MKTCSQCPKTKPESEYFMRDKAKGRLQSACKSCYSENRKSYQHEHYEKYGDSYRQRARERRARIKRASRLKIAAYMADKSCIYCGESEMCALDFDHLDPSTKRFNVSAGIHKGLAWELILDEISRCRILCANCHRKHTAVQNDWYKNIQGS